MGGFTRFSGAYRRHVVTILAIVVLLTAMPGVALAETRAGGAVVVGADETVDGDLEAFGGSITVRGTVDGDVQAVGGTVQIEGTVTGDVSVTAGSVVIGPDATIEGSLEGAAGDVTIAGNVAGNVEIGAGTIAVTDTAVLGGDLAYDGTLDQAPGASISGEVSQQAGLGDPSMFGTSIPAWLPGVYVFATGLLMAVILLAVFPAFSRDVADGVIHSPGRSVGVGLLALISVPIALMGLILTLVGIPLAVIGLIVSLIGLWIGGLYGRYAVGEYVLGRSGMDNRWLALLVGFLVVGIAVRLPLLGGLLNLLVMVVGLGALTDALYRRYRQSGGEDTVQADETQPL